MLFQKHPWLSKHGGHKTLIQKRELCLLLGQRARARERSGLRLLAALSGMSLNGPASGWSTRQSAATNSCHNPLSQFSSPLTTQGEQLTQESCCLPGGAPFQTRQEGRRWQGRQSQTVRKATGLSRSSSPLPSRLQELLSLGLAWLRALGQLQGGGLAWTTSRVGAHRGSR